MIIQPCSEQSKKIVFDKFINNSLGQYMVVDNMDTLSEFSESFGDGSKEILSDDEKELLMIYKTDVPPSPDDYFILFTYIIPLDVCFPSYTRPSLVIKEAINQIFNDYDDKDVILCILPNLPFIGQALLLAGFSVYEGHVIKNISTKNGEAIDGYCFIKYRI